MRLGIERVPGKEFPVGRHHRFDVAQFEHALITAGVTHSATVYPGAAHGYTMADTAMYHHDAAEHHFSELRKLFAHTLH